MKRILIAALTSLGLGVSPVLGQASEPQSAHIGVYYFPGWRDGQDRVGAAYAHPWDKIKPFPEREPLLGWYKEGDQKVMDQQIRWMRAYGLSYVVFSQLSWPDGHPQLEHATRAFMRSTVKGDLKFAIQWANHTKLPENSEQFEAMMRYWIDNYFQRADYFRIDGEPVLFIFSSWQLRQNVEGYGGVVADLLARGQQMAKEAGLPGVLFVAGGETRSDSIRRDLADGYQAISAYNYHNGPEGEVSRSYEELDQGYRHNWDGVLSANAGGLFILPMTAGWDRRPWGGSRVSEHDNSSSTPDQFEAHLQAGRAAMARNPSMTRGYGVVCCWNEFGEGSIVEPTKRWGESYLANIEAVFGGGSNGKGQPGDD